LFASATAATFELRRARKRINQPSLCSTCRICARTLTYQHAGETDL
jgi:hypothetical protein